jgi:DNA-binding NarL/FixJ family response regulator
VDESRPAEPLRVVVADDHPFYRRGLVHALRSRGIYVVAEAPNGEAAVDAVQETAPDVVVMDLKMPGMSGVEATRRVTKRAPDSRVLVLSVSVEEEDVTDAILAGACSYVLKDRPVDEVIAAVRATASGRTHVSPQIAMTVLRCLFEPGGAGPDLPALRLSAVELEVLDLLARGEADGEIAATLGIDVDAVRRHAASILMRLGFEHGVQAGLRAYRRRHG